MSVTHSLRSLGSTEFDALTRSEAVVTRRIGGGRIVVWRDGDWRPAPPRPPRAQPAAAAPADATTPAAAARHAPPVHPRRTRPLPDRCKNNHPANWRVSPTNGWRYCRTCQAIGLAARKIARNALQGVAEVVINRQT